jgi:hypothetical protein
VTDGPSVEAKEIIASFEERAWRETLRFTTARADREFLPRVAWVGLKHREASIGQISGLHR